MASIRIHIDDDVVQQLSRLAELTGMSRSQIAHAAIIDKLEELEDSRIVAERLAKPFKTISNDDVWRELNIRD